MIVETFSFSSELDMLEIKLGFHEKFVDKFVIVESPITFQGNAKAMFLKENWNRFARWHHKIERIESLALHGNQKPFVREAQQRNAALPALEALPVDSRILISDVDEFVDFKKLPTEGTWCCDMDWFYYWMNMHITSASASIWTTIGEMGNDLQHIRNIRDFGVKRIRNGWHFSYTGGPKAILDKLLSFGHSEFRHFADEEKIKQALKTDWKHNIDLLGRKGFHFEIWSDDKLPEFAVEAMRRFPYLRYAP